MASKKKDNPPEPASVRLFRAIFDRIICDIGRPTLEKIYNDLKNKKDLSLFPLKLVIEGVLGLVPCEVSTYLFDFEKNRGKAEVIDLNTWKKQHQNLDLKEAI